MEGGIRAWEGVVAAGPPDAGTAFFSGAERPEELLALAWVLEEGSRRFYAAISALVADDETKRLFQDLTAAEEHHKAALSSLFRILTNSEPGQDFPGSLIGLRAADDRMEGGMSVGEALQWAKGKSGAEILDLAVALETNAYDLYIRMKQRIHDDRSRQVFDQLSAEEKKHLELLTGLFERKL